MRSTLWSYKILPVLVILPVITSAPLGDLNGNDDAALTNTSSGPIPGQSPLYSTYNGTGAPWPGNTTGAILNPTYGSASPDDKLFQNLLSAEWVIFSFYQQGVELFNSTAFTSAGFLNTTYERIQQIRDNEAGHLRIFQDQISTNSVKPGPCKYQFPFKDVKSFLALQTAIEIGSMTFLTGLALQAQLPISKGALVAIAETESRHNTWSLIDVWGVNPFAGPSDTYFPYANQILDTTNAYIVPHSCPKGNPAIYPNPRQNLPPIAAATTTKSLTPGSYVVFKFPDPTNQPTFRYGAEYYAVYFHGVANISMPFNTTSNSSTIPSEFEELGAIVTVIADTIGAPTKETVIAGPGIILEQPAAVGLALAIGG